MRTSVFIAQSLDGFIAKKDGDIEWLNEASQKAKDEDLGYESFMESCDYLIMGKNSFMKVLSFDTWPYDGEKVIVVSSTLKRLPEDIKNVTLFNGDIKDLHTKLKNENCKKLYIDGGKLISSFLNENLVTDITVTNIPIFLGKGIKLFNNVNTKLQFKAKESTVFPSGLVKIKYEKC